MIEEKFKSIESKIFKLLDENQRLKAELEVVQSQLHQRVAESTLSLETLKNESAETIERLQIESAIALQALQDENDLIKSRNSELTMHLKKIMSRLESLGVE